MINWRDDYGDGDLAIGDDGDKNSERRRSAGGAMQWCPSTSSGWRCEAALKKGRSSGVSSSRDFNDATSSFASPELCGMAGIGSGSFDSRHQTFDFVVVALSCGVFSHDPSKGGGWCRQSPIGYSEMVEQLDLPKQQCGEQQKRRCRISWCQREKELRRSINVWQ